MKSIFTLLLSTLFSLSLLAYDGTRLTISSINTNKMFVEVDGRRFTMDENTVTLRDLSTGYHSIRIYTELKKNNGRGIGFGLGKKIRQETIYNNRIFLKNGYHLDIVVNRFGKVFTDERRADRNDDWYNDDDDWDRYDHDRYDHFNRVMDGRDFSQAKETLKREWFENNRMTQAKQIIDRNFFTTDMVKEMLYLFTFENNRLEMAKYMYGHTVDKGNYFKISDVLLMSRSKDELNRYIRDYR